MSAATHAVRPARSLDCQRGTAGADGRDGAHRRRGSIAHFCVASNAQCAVSLRMSGTSASVWYRELPTMTICRVRPRESCSAARSPTRPLVLSCRVGSSWGRPCLRTALPGPGDLWTANGALFGPRPGRGGGIRPAMALHFDLSPWALASGHRVPQRSTRVVHRASRGRCHPSINSLTCLPPPTFLRASVPLCLAWSPPLSQNGFPFGRAPYLSVLVLSANVFVAAASQSAHVGCARGRGPSDGSAWAARLFFGSAHGRGGWARRQG